MKVLLFIDRLNLEMVKLTVGIRIYPNTALAKKAVADGVISADDDLLQPRFYLARGLEEQLPKMARAWLSKRSNWVT